jgi:hypothetical protein
VQQPTPSARQARAAKSYAACSVVAPKGFFGPIGEAGYAGAPWPLAIKPNHPADGNLVLTRADDLPQALQTQATGCSKLARGRLHSRRTGSQPKYTTDLVVSPPSRLGPQVVAGSRTDDRRGAELHLAVPVTEPAPGPDLPDLAAGTGNGNRANGRRDRKPSQRTPGSGTRTDNFTDAP